ncbi:hypothetical protein HK103_007398 [Boothiomyces macroporosus]|uniref:Anaphase-promoting complex subunit 4 WD40 domain-containing protein n=1 Tax=Boothiomyces macroporosus TaxID=261099 RepID=A0AAD5UKT9_9FUNG|nr:hypothetical protein HK103_007398 [Boothiomyces macroporosus]
MNHFKVKHILDDHTQAISYVAWSPDDKMILSASNDTTLNAWDTNTGKLLRTYDKHADPVNCCAWLPCGTRFVSGSVEKSMYLWHVDGTVLHHWPGIRIMDIKITSDGQRLIVSSDKKIRIYSLIDYQEISIFEEKDSITSICLSRDDRHLLVNLSSSKMQLWDIETKSIAKKYYGQKTGRFIIRSCFAGIDENLIICGNEGNYC